jgi:hypothetical protein
VKTQVFLGGVEQGNSSPPNMFLGYAQPG